MPEEKSDLELLAEGPAAWARKHSKENPPRNYDAARFLLELHQAKKEHELSEKIDLLANSMELLHKSLKTLHVDVKRILAR